MKLFHLKDKKPEKVWFLIEFQQDEVRHIVDEQTLELMLTIGDGDVFSIFNMGFTNNCGWHVGKDEKVYERHSINLAGESAISRLPKIYNGQNIFIDKPYRYLRALDMVKALEEINCGTPTARYKNEIKLINSYFTKQQIKSITKYDGREIVKPVTMAKNKHNEKAQSL